MLHWLVIDLEATTEEGGWPITDMEIIEIGACIINLHGQEISAFQRFVKPLRRPQLTRFCRELTHIHQQQVDSAVPFSQAWLDCEQWLDSYRTHLVGWASWGDYDRLQLNHAWQHSQLNSLLQDLPHLNLKQQLALQRQWARPVGLHKALQLTGMNFQGHQHRALDDARNTARLLPLALPSSGR